MCIIKFVFRIIEFILNDLGFLNTRSQPYIFNKLEYIFLPIFQHYSIVERSRNNNVMHVQEIQNSDS